MFLLLEVSELGESLSETGSEVIAYISMTRNAKIVHFVYSPSHNEFQVINFTTCLRSVEDQDDIVLAFDMMIALC